jgi:mannose/fructose/N-acetylgalactosamine-specific phosphotransferase system component IIC
MEIGYLNLFESFLIALWAFWVSLDERAVGPLGCGQPLGAAFVTGLIAGRPADGLVMGVALQAIWPGLVPMGGAPQPDAGSAAIAGTAWWVAFDAAGAPVAGIGRGMNWAFPLACSVAIVCATLGERFERILRARNARREDALHLDSRSHDSLIAMRRRLRRIVAAGAFEAGLKGAIVWMIALAPLALIAAIHPAGLPVGGAFARASDLPPGAVLLTALPLIAFALGACARRAARAWQTPFARGSNGQPAARPDVAFARLPLGLAGLGRLLLLQAAFSRQHLQRTGFLYAWLFRTRVRADILDDVGRQLASGKPANTHPILAAALLGGLERVSVDAASTPPPRPPARLVEIAGPLLSQWGDRALWGGLRLAFALVALALAPFAPAAVVFAYVGLSILAQLLGRVLFHRWGTAQGWALVGRRGVGWSLLSRWGAPAAAPLAAIAAAALAGFFLRDSRPCAWLVTAGGFIFGVLVGGRAAPPPLAWGWLCAGTGALGALLMAVCG